MSQKCNVPGCPCTNFVQGDGPQQNKCKTCGHSSQQHV